MQRFTGYSHCHTTQTLDLRSAYTTPLLNHTIKGNVFQTCASLERSFVLSEADAQTPVHEPVEPLSANLTVSEAMARKYRNCTQFARQLIRSIASLPFTFRVGTLSGLSFDPSMPAMVPRSTIGPRDDNFTGNHKLVIVLVVLAVIAGILLVVFSSQKAEEQDRQAKERGAFLRGLAAPLPALRGLRM